MGLVLPGYTELAVPITWFPVRRGRSGRLHAPRQDHRLPRWIRRIRQLTAYRRCRGGPIAPRPQGPVPSRHQPWRAGRRSGGTGYRAVPGAIDTPAGRTVTRSVDADPLVGLPQSRPTSARGRAGGRHGAVRLPDRRGSASGRPSSTPRGGQRATGRQVLPRPRRSGLAR
jgi:hypothetical protein